MTIAGRVAARLLTRLLAAVDEPVTLRLWDGTGIHVGRAAPAACSVTLRTPAVLWRLLRRPTALTIGEAFIAGDVDIGGDAFAAVRAAQQLAGSSARRRGRRPLPDDIGFHYDVSNDFYALFLDPRMVYTCAYYPHPDASLDEAQEAKLDLICRKLRLDPGERLLDLGCGWGALVLWAAAHYGVEAHGVTLSRAQAAWATDAIRRAGLEDRARVEYRDWRDLSPHETFDKIAAVGLIEHVGHEAYDEFFGAVHARLAPGGRFLNHGITNRPDAGWSDQMEFLSRHVFPAGELATVSTLQHCMERHGFEIVDVENLRAHYAQTTRTWAERLLGQADAARQLVGERTYRTWIGYLAAATTAFEAGWIALHQVVATPIADAARWTTPTTRSAARGTRPRVDVARVS